MATGELMRSVGGGPPALAGRLIERLATQRPRHGITYAAPAALIGGTVQLVEIHLAGFGHGPHLLLILTIVMAIALTLGPRSATIVLGIGFFGRIVASLGSSDPASLTGTALYVSLYLVAGGAFLVVVAGAIRLQRQRLLDAPSVSMSSGLVERLTPREVGILRLAASGLRLSEIAERLYLSPNTVKTHLSHAYGKLGADNRQEAIRLAIHHGWLEFSDVCPHHFQGHPGNSTPG